MRPECILTVVKQCGRNVLCYQRVPQCLVNLPKAMTLGGARRRAPYGSRVLTALVAVCSRRDCHLAGVSQPVSGFHFQNKKRGILRPDCKKCRLSFKNERSRTDSRYIASGIVNHCKKHDAKAKRGVPNIAKAQVLGFLGKPCYISGHLTAVERGRWNSTSLERIDESLPHNFENVRPVCQIFQSASQKTYDGQISLNQWTREKFEYFVECYLNPPSTDAMRRTMHCCDAPQRKRWTKRKRSLGNGDLHCTRCDTFKAPDKFSDRRDGKRSFCKKCLSDSRSETLHSKILRLIHYCRHNDRGKGREGIDLTPEFVLDLYKKQLGRCIYTNVPLALSGAWMISIERKDNKRAHTKDNVVLCCFETNTPFHWSKEIVESLTNTDKPQT